MSLKPPNSDLFKVEVGGISFAMIDADLDAEQVVRCFVTTEALEHRGSDDGATDYDLENLFQSYQPQLYRIAAAQYDHGNKSPRITTADLG
jgi:hypothetical protein